MVPFKAPEACLTRLPTFMAQYKVLAACLTRLPTSMVQYETLQPAPQDCPPTSMVQYKALAACLTKLPTFMVPFKGTTYFQNVLSEIIVPEYNLPSVTQRMAAVFLINENKTDLFTVDSRFLTKKMHIYLTANSH
jgi:hypothetical protein